MFVSFGGRNQFHFEVRSNQQPKNKNKKDSKNWKSENERKNEQQSAGKIVNLLFDDRNVIEILIENSKIKTKFGIWNIIYGMNWG